MEYILDAASESRASNSSCDEFEVGFLSEETEDNGSRFEEDYFWCIDPMDGTLAFINGHPGFSVSIALEESS